MVPLFSNPIAVLMAGLSIGVTITLGFLAVFLSEEHAQAENMSDAMLGEACRYEHSAFGLEKTECGLVEGNAVVDSSKNSEVNQSESLEIERVIIMSGQKSVVAGADTFMAMGIAEMPDGTLAPDGSRFEFLTSDNNARIVTQTLGGVAYHVYGAPTEAGYIEVIGRWGTVSTLPNTIRIVPAGPVQVGLQDRPVRGRLSGDRQYWIKSAVLADQYGNTLSDGSFIQFKGVDDENRSVFLNTMLVNGAASAKFIQREMTGSLRLSGQHKDIIGSEIQISLGKTDVQDDFHVSFMEQGGAVDLTIGPLRNASGAFVPDGFQLALQLGDGREVFALTYNGVAVFAYSWADKNIPAQLKLRAGSKVWQLDVPGRSAENTDKIVKFVHGAVGEAS